jgi:hypothetical protein
MKIHRQQGLSIIGFLMVLAMTLFVTFIGMRIVPIYIEYYSVVNALNGVASERGSANLSLYDLRAKVLNRLYVSYSDNVKESDIKKVRRNGIFLRVAYEVRKPVIGNLDVIATFDKSVRLSN